MSSILQQHAIVLAASLAALGLASEPAYAQWQPWAALGNQKFDAQTGVRALMPGPGKVNLVAISKDDKVYANYWQKDKGWQGWSAIGALKLSLKNPVEILLSADEHIDLFSVTSGGKVRTASWDKKGPWKEWATIGEQAFEPGTRVTALEPREGHVSLFAVGKDRKVYTTSRAHGKEWQEWSAVGDVKLAAGAWVAALHRPSGRIDLFTVNRDGRVAGTFREEKAKDWQKWIDIGEGYFDPAAGITPVPNAKNPSRIDLIALGKDRRSYNTFTEDDKTWKNWLLIGPFQFAEKTRMSAWSQPYGIDLFAVGPFGAVRTVVGDTEKGWPKQWDFIGPGSITNPITDLAFVPAAPVTVLDRQPHRENRIDLFVVSRDGRVHTSYAEIKK